MKEHPPTEHFEGKSVYEHLKDARARGALASAEVHGIEMPGHLAAAWDAAKDMAITLVILWVLCLNFSLSAKNAFLFSALFAFGVIIWKTGRSALLGWSRLERLHRVIEEERWEIEHHRAQEREELMELYQVKGFNGKLLEEVVDVLMADDNRLLRVMLEEELNLTLECFEHPLKQATGAAFGALVSAAICLCLETLVPTLGILAAAFFIILLASFASARLERNRALPIVVWNLALAGMSAAVVHFSLQFFIQKS